MPGRESLTILNAYPDYWLLTDTIGQGSLVLQKTPNNYYFLSYLDDTFDPVDIQIEIKEITELFVSDS